MSELKKKYLNVKSMRSDCDISGHICDDYILELEQIIKDKIVDYDELKFENNRLSDKNKQLEQEKAELKELITHLKYNAGLDEYSENYIDEILKKHS